MGVEGRAHIPSRAAGVASNREGKGRDRASALLQLEADIRKVESIEELAFHMVNKPRGLLCYKQATLFQRESQGFKVKAVSSIAAPERTSPLIRWLQAMVSKMDEQADSSCIQAFKSPAFTDLSHAPPDGYPYRYFLWVPVVSGKKGVLTGLLLASDLPWHDSVRTIADRLSQTYAHAWKALPGGQPKVRMNWRRFARFLGLGALIAGFLLQVPVVAVAPAEVVGRSPGVVAASMNGVIHEVLVEPNKWVPAGTELLRFENTDLRSALMVAVRREAVAGAKLENAKQSAFVDPGAAADIAVAEAELELASVERAQAQARLDRTILRSDRAGIAIFPDRRSLTGKPVAIGERIMEIIDEGDLGFRVDLSPSDQIVLEDGSKVKILLDSAPLDPVTAGISRMSYRATADANGDLAFRLEAMPAGEWPDGVRLGARGIAVLSGDAAPFWFVALRRPILWFRKTFGV